MPETGRRVALWIEVDEQSALSTFGNPSAQIDRSRRFSNAAFLIRNAQDPGQVFYSAV